MDDCLLLTLYWGFNTFISVDCFNGWLLGKTTYFMSIGEKGNYIQRYQLKSANERYYLKSANDRKTWTTLENIGLRMD